MPIEQAKPDSEEAFFVFKVKIYSVKQQLIRISTTPVMRDGRA